MALQVADRVQVQSTSYTTGSFTLGTTPVTGFQNFTALTSGNTTYYAATDVSGNWEVGYGTYSSVTPSLSRTTILSSNNSGAAASFSGTVNIFITYPAEKSVNLDPSNNVVFAGYTAQRFQADFTNATFNSRFAFQTSTTNSTTGIYALPNGTSTAASWQATNNSDPTNASKILIATNGTTDVQLVSGINGTGTYLPLSFYTNGSQSAQLDTSANFKTNGQSIVGNGLFVNNQTISTSYSIPSGYAAHSVGPITLSSGVSITVPSGSRWVVA